jgi:MFS family permease
MTLVFACAAMLVSYLPFSAVNGVLGTIGTATGAGTGDLQWVTDAFTVALVGAVLSAGVLGDLYGRKRVALAGLGLTVVSTVTGFIAGGLHGAAGIHLLWLGQAAGGLGAGMVMSSTLALVAATAPTAAARTRAIAAWAAANVIGLGGGPFLSGVIADHASWRWLYPPITVLALAAVTFGASRARESAAPAGRRLDWPGQVTGAAGVVALVYGVIHGGVSGWMTPATLAGLAVGALGLAAFVLVEHRAAAPLLRPQLFASGGFTAAGLAAMAVLFTVVGVVFVLTLFFAHQQVSGIGIAVRLGCLFGGNAAASLTSARLQALTSPRTVLITGLLIAAAGVTSLLTITGATGLGGFAWRLAIAGAGCGLVVATSTAVAVQSVPPELAGMAGAANNAVRQFGGALGTAVIGVVFADQLHAGAGYAGAVHSCAITLIVLLAVAAVAAAALLFARRPSPAA